MKFGLIVFGLLVVGYAHWPWPGRLAAQAREDSPLAARQRMVEDQIKARGIKDARVLAAMFFGPFASGLLGEEHAGIFVTAVGALALAVGGRLLFTSSGRRAAEVYRG